MPALKRRLDLERVYSPAEYAAISRGCTPRQMEDKWFIFLEADRLYLCRSWSGHCIYEVHFAETGIGHAISQAWVNRDPDQYASADDSDDAALLLYLIDSLLLNYDVPFPGRQGLGVAGNALYAWSEIGRGRDGNDGEGSSAVTVVLAKRHPIICSYGCAAAATYDLILVIGREPNSDHEVVNQIGTYDFCTAPHCGFWNASYALAARTVGLLPAEFKHLCRQHNGSPLLYADALPQGLLNSTPDKCRRRKSIPETLIREHIENIFSHSIVDRVKLLILSGIAGPVFKTSRDLIGAECHKRGIPICVLPFFSNQNAKRITQQLDPESQRHIATIISRFRSAGEAV